MLETQGREVRNRECGWCGELPRVGPQPSTGLQQHSPGTELSGSMVTRTEDSKGTEPPTTRHTYSPESAGDTWCSRSSEPWVWPE